MIKFTTIFISIMQLKSFVDGAAYLLEPQEKPPEFADQDGCYVPGLKKVIEYNTSYYPDDGKCTEYQCRIDGYTGVHSCGPVAISENCVLVREDKSLPFPKCCDKSKCSFNDVETVLKKPKIYPTPCYPNVAAGPFDAAVERPEICVSPPIAEPPKVEDGSDVGLAVENRGL